MRVRHRLLLTMTATGLVGAAIVAGGSLWLLRSVIQRPYLERLRAECALLADTVARSGAEDPHDFAQRAGQSLGVRVTLIADDGTVVGESGRERSELAAIESHLDRPEVRDARLRGQGESLRSSATTQVRYFYSARRVNGAGPVQYVRLAAPPDDVFRAQAGYLGTIVAIALASMLLMAAVAYAAVRRLSRPLETLTDAVDRIASGAPQVHVPVVGGLEVTRLAGGIRRMQFTLLDKIGELDAERDLVVSVIAGMREALLLVGEDRHIRLANGAARRIFDLPFDPTGHLLAEVVRDPILYRDVETALVERREVRESVVRSSSGRSFEAHVTPVRRAKTDEAEALVLLFDITRLESLEGVRRQFVANVSHELRTPLTSIKAFVENLIDGGLEDPANALRFAQIISKHADRMGALIDDLTDLSLIETGSIRLELGDIDLVDVARDVTEQLRPRAQARDVRLILDLPESLTVRADRRRMEQALTNLVENAIKFNKPGGHVRVAVQAQPRPGVIVEDSGIGIPSDSLEKIFNRFYQVDTARSREAGGTGLGLAIVKHLMRLQGGTVSVASEFGSGSRFTLEFPLPEPLPGPAPLEIERPNG